MRPNPHNATRHTIRFVILIMSLVLVAGCGNEPRSTATRDPGSGSVRTQEIPRTASTATFTATKSPTASATLTPDPWARAIIEVTQIVSQAPALETHLQNYPQKALELNQVIAGVEKTRPLLDTLDRLRNFKMPLGLGNGYDALIFALNTYSSGAGDGLKTVEAGLRKLLAFKGKLDRLQSMPQAAKPVSIFRSNPTPENLVALDTSFNSAIPTLESVDADLSDALGTF